MSRPIDPQTPEFRANRTTRRRLTRAPVGWREIRVNLGRRHGRVLTGVTFDMSPVQRAPISHKCPGDVPPPNTRPRRSGSRVRRRLCGTPGQTNRGEPVGTSLAGCEFFLSWLWLRGYPRRIPILWRAVCRSRIDQPVRFPVQLGRNRDCGCARQRPAHAPRVPGGPARLSPTRREVCFFPGARPRVAAARATSRPVPLPRGAVLARQIFPARLGEGWPRCPPEARRA